MRLHKFIANCGYTSRRRAELLIQAGRVQLNDKTVTELGTLVHPGKDRVTINGDLVLPPERMTIMLHKPANYITSTHDTHDRLTVMDLLSRRIQELGVKPVGRLDRDTTGLLVLTNDGDLNHRITHPRYETEKEYLVEVRGRPSPEALQRLRDGISIEGRVTSPAHIQPLTSTRNARSVTVVISEGRKRQIKKMFDSIGHPVGILRRVRVGKLKLGNLKPGKWRVLSSKETELLNDQTKK